jgi:hypothetical protein
MDNLDKKNNLDLIQGAGGGGGKAGGGFCKYYWRQP